MAMSTRDTFALLLALLVACSLKPALASSSFLSPYRGFSLFLEDREIRTALQGGHLANELSVFENGFENRWLISALSTPRISLAPSKEFLRFSWENKGKYSLHYHVTATFRGNSAANSGNASPKPSISIPSTGFLMPGSEHAFEIRFPCMRETVGNYVMQLNFNIGQTLTTSLFFFRTCTEEYASRSQKKVDLTSNSYEDLLAQETEVQESRPARNRTDPVCLLARRYCGFPSSSECPQAPVCRRVCRMPRKRNGERLARICNASALITATLVSMRPRKHGRCGTALQFSTEFAQSYSKGANASYISFTSQRSATFRVVVPEQLAKCQCLDELAADTQYILSGRWNAAKSRLHLDADSLLVRSRRKLKAYLIRSDCSSML